MNQRPTVRVLAAVVAVLFSVSLAVTNPSSPASASTSSPTFSARGICVNGRAEMSFTVSGLTQLTGVLLQVYDGPDTTGQRFVLMGTGVSTTEWINSNANPNLHSGTQIVAVQINNTWIQAC